MNSAISGALLNQHLFIQNMTCLGARGRARYVYDKAPQLTELSREELYRIECCKAAER